MSALKPTRVEVLKVPPVLDVRGHMDKLVHLWHANVALGLENILHLRHQVNKGLIELCQVACGVPSRQVVTVHCHASLACLRHQLSELPAIIHKAVDKVGQHLQHASWHKWSSRYGISISQITQDPKPK